MHDLVRLYAGEQASERVTPDRRREAPHRLLDHYLHTAHVADRALNPHREPLDLPRIEPNVVCEDFADHRAALDWFVAERSVLMAALDQAAGTGFERHACRRQALADCQQALTLYQEIGDRSGQAATWDSLGYARRQLGDHQQAITCYQHALELFRELGYRYFEGSTLAALGDTHHAAGDPTAARRAWQHAVTILDDLGHHNADQVRAKLHQVEVPVGRP